MNIKETINYLQEFEVKMTAPGLRAAIRRGEIGGASKTSEKGEIDISNSSVLEYALNKTHNRLLTCPSCQTKLNNGQIFQKFL